MLLDTYETQGLLFNSNFKDNAGANLQAYRGDLVLIEGEIADAMGRRKPPLATMIGAVLLSDAEKLKFVSGSLDEVAQMTAFIDKYQSDFAPGMGALLFVVNLAKPLQVEMAGVNFILLPLADGLAWNELVDELRLEKGDFKGQSSGEKVHTLYKAFQDYRPRGETTTFEQALTCITDAKRAIYGAV